jgi:hypothetical protein
MSHWSQGLSQTNPCLRACVRDVALEIFSP